MTMEIEVPPYEPTPIPGTALVVSHQGDEESYVHVEDDGSVRLCGGPDWTVRLAVPGSAAATAYKLPTPKGN
jgi:hypothetical protein